MKNNGLFIAIVIIVLAVLLYLGRKPTLSRAPKRQSFQLIPTSIEGNDVYYGRADAESLAAYNSFDAIYGPPSAGACVGVQKGYSSIYEDSW
jgi:hypothetical protein